VQTKPSKVDDYFGTFLETLNSRPAPTSPTQEDRGDAADTSTEPSQFEDALQSDESSTADSGRSLERPATATLDLTTRAIGALRTTEKTPVTTFQATLGLGFTEFGELMLTLDGLGLIAIQGAPGSEDIVLTPQGRLLAQMT